MALLFLLGLDGGRLLTAERLVKKNKLPVFEELLKHSTSSYLDSTIPPITIPAWGVIFSGKNPGKLGCVDFIRPSRDYKPLLNKYGKEKWVWDYLCEHNIPCAIFRAISINPYRIKLGFFTDFKKCFPKNPKLILEEREISPEMSYEEKIKITMENFERESEVVLKFMRKNMPHRFVVFTTAMIDAVSHLTHKEKRIEEAYVLVDEFLERLLPVLRKRGFSLMVVSDHGIKKVEKRANINRMFERVGLLKPSDNIKESLMLRLFKGVISNKFVRKLFHDSLIASLFRKKEIKGIRMEDLFNQIDFSSTKLFGFGTCTPSEYALVWVNDGRFELGKKENRTEKDELKEMLKENFPKIVEEVYEKGEVWHGDKMNSLPDFVVKLNEEYTSEYRLFTGVTMKCESFVHSKDGLFIFTDFSERERKHVNISNQDITPIILGLFKMKIPKVIDGKNLSTRF